MNNDEENNSLINKSIDKFVLLYGHIFKKLSDILAVIIASIFFIFYQVFVQFLWLGLAIKLVDWIVSFNYLKKIDTYISEKLQRTTRWESFIIFIIPLIPMEYFAIMAGFAFVDGNVALGITLYALKFACAIPVSYIYKHTKKELLLLGKYKSFDVSYTDEEFTIAHENNHTSFNMKASNIPIGWISLPKFIINLSIYIIKNSAIFISLSAWFKKVALFIKEKYRSIKDVLFSQLDSAKKEQIKTNISYKIKKIFNYLKSKFNK